MKTTSTTRATRLVAVITSAAIVTGCDSTNYAPVAFASLDARAQSAYAAHLRRAFATWNPTVSINVEPATLDGSPRDAATLRSLGYIRGAAGSYAFTATGRRASADCTTHVTNPCRAFAVARGRLVGARTIELHTSGGLGGVQFVRIGVATRSVPLPGLGAALARSASLHCAYDGKIVPWRGASTVADSVVTFDTTRVGENTTPSEMADALDDTPNAYSHLNLGLSCPSTQLR